FKAEVESDRLGMAWAVAVVHEDRARIFVCELIVVRENLVIQEGIGKLAHKPKRRRLTCIETLPKSSPLLARTIAQRAPTAVERPGLRKEMKARLPLEEGRAVQTPGVQETLPEIFAQFGPCWWLVQQARAGGHRNVCAVVIERCECHSATQAVSVRNRVQCKASERITKPADPRGEAERPERSERCVNRPRDLREQDRTLVVGELERVRERESIDVGTKVCARHSARAYAPSASQFPLWPSN